MLDSLRRDLSATDLEGLFFGGGREVRTTRPPRLVEDSVEETGRRVKILVLLEPQTLLAADPLQSPETAAGSRDWR